MVKISDETLQSVWDAVNIVSDNIAKNPRMTMGALGIAAKITRGHMRVRELSNALFSIVHEERGGMKTAKSFFVCLVIANGQVCF